MRDIRRMKRHVIIGTLALACLTVTAACGSSVANDAAQVASLADGSAHSTTTTAAGSDGVSQADTEQAMLDFARCMREHGVDMPDPQFDGEGGATFTAGVASGDSPIDKTKMDEAQKACQSYMDKVRASMPPPDPAKIEEQKQQLLEFAQCMRDHGVDFPDPTFDDSSGGLQVQMGGPGMDPDSPGFKAASDACAGEAGGPGIGIATGGPKP
jgi:hypothetical protein